MPFSGIRGGSNSLERGGLRSAKGVADAEVFRVKKSAVLVTSVSGGGVKGGQAFLSPR